MSEPMTFEQWWKTSGNLVIKTKKGMSIDSWHARDAEVEALRAENERLKAVADRMADLFRLVEGRKAGHRLTSQCDRPRTCGACHFYSGYAQAIADIVENRFPTVTTTHEKNT